VDEALFLADRIVMMTDGPEAEVGDVLTVPFPRPRERQAVLEHPEYYRLREHLIEFLEVHAHRKNATPELTETRSVRKTRHADGGQAANRIAPEPAHTER